MRKILILVIALIVLTICLCDLFYVKNTFETMVARASAIETEVEENGLSERAKEKINEMFIKWNEKERGVGIFVYSAEIKVLSENIFMIKVLAEENDLEEIRIQVKLLKNMLSSFQKQYSFNGINLL